MTNVVEGTLVYVCIQTPTTKYQSTDKEFKVGIVVDEDTADAWDEQFPKQSAKAAKTAEFKDLYKIDPVFPSEKKQYIINLKKPAQYKDGNPLPEQYTPKVLVPVDGGKYEDVTQTVLPANGSKGKVSYEVTSNDYGTFARLKNVLVTDMIEYKKASTDAAADFGGSTVAKGEEDFSEAPAKPVAAKKTTRRAAEEESEPDSPF